MVLTKVIDKGELRYQIKTIACRDLNAKLTQKEGQMSKEERTPEEQKQIDEWLKTNEVKVYAPGERTSDDQVGYTHGWGKKKKKVPPKKVDKQTIRSYTVYNNQATEGIQNGIRFTARQGKTSTRD